MASGELADHNTSLYSRSGIVVFCDMIFKYEIRGDVDMSYTTCQLHNRRVDGSQCILMHKPKGKPWFTEIHIF